MKINYRFFLIKKNLLLTRVICTARIDVIFYNKKVLT